jgi:hypothetical protein
VVKLTLPISRHEKKVRFNLWNYNISQPNFSVLDKVLNSWYWNLYRQRLQAYFGSDPALVEKNEGDVASLLALMCGSPKRKQIGAAWNAEVEDFSGDSNLMLEAYTDEVFGDGCLDKFKEIFLLESDAQVFQSLIVKVGVSVESIQNSNPPDLVADADALTYRRAIFGKVSAVFMLDSSYLILTLFLYQISSM